MKTWNAKAGEVERGWWIVDATDKTVGRLATEVARVLRGKHKPTFTPHVDMGDFVVVINSEKLRMSGNKWIDKKYYRQSRFFGSLKSLTAKEMMEKKPADIIVEAVSGMLPKSKLGRRQIKKLKAYQGGEHPHSAQKPQALTVV